MIYVYWFLNVEPDWHSWDKSHLIIVHSNGTPLQYSFAWKIPWTEEPGRLQSMEVLRVGYDEWLHFHALEKEMAIHSSVLAWRIPGRGESGGCPLWGHRVGHNWSDLAVAAAWCIVLLLDSIYNFVEDFCIYGLETYWSVVFFSFIVIFVLFWC